MSAIRRLWKWSFPKLIVLIIGILLAYGFLTISRMLLVSNTETVIVADVTITELYRVNDEEFFKKWGVSRVEFIEGNHLIGEENRNTLHHIVEALRAEGIEVKVGKETPISHPLND